MKTKSLLVLSAIGSIIIVFVALAGTNFLGEKEDINSENYLANQILTICEDDMHCVTTQLTNLSQERDQNIVLAVYDELGGLYHEQQFFRCHHVSHHLGMWIYGYTQDVERALEFADPIKCGGGIFHGVFQNYFATLLFQNISPKEIKILDLCSKYQSQPYSFSKAQCVHGIGHGLMVLYDYDFNSALERCKEFDSKEEQHSCANGIFMQNINKYDESGEGNFDEENIHYPCDTVNSNFASSCYLNHAQYILSKNDFEVYSSFHECDNIVTKELIKYCYFGIGLILQIDAKGNMNKALLFCEAGSNTELHPICIKGMLFGTSGVHLSNGLSFCSAIPEQYKSECYDSLGYLIKLRNPTEDEVAKECALIKDSDYFEICMNAKIDDLSHI